MSLSLGIISLLLSFSNNFDLARIIFGHLFVFIFSGLPLSRLFIPKTNFLERLVSSALFSILLTYPATVIVTILEGQSGVAIYSRHLALSMFVLFVLSQILPRLARVLLAKSTPLLPSAPHHPISITPLLLISLLTFSFFVFTNLNRADVYGDEYDLAYQSYNLVNGIQAGRKAYVISYDTHPPLSSALKHFSLNLLDPSGIDYLQDWQFRFSEGLLGLLTIISVYLLAAEFFSYQVASLSALLLACNNYLVWMGRIYHREMTLTFFMALTLYYLYKSLKHKTSATMLGISFGAALLTKETSLILLPLIILAAVRRHYLFKSLVIALILFLPVLIFNLAAFMTTGYVDVFFSSLFGIYRSGITYSQQFQPLQNFIFTLSYLNDIYSPFILATFFVAVVYQSIIILRHLKKPPTISWLVLWLVVSLSFFSLTATRGYYFVFISIPLVIITASFITGIQSKLVQRLIALLVLSVSFVFTLNSNLIRSDLSTPIPSDVDGGVVINHPFLLPYSREVLSWTYQWGYKNLVSYLDSHRHYFDCLAFDQSFDPLAARRYFWAEDTIKEHYLGDYLHRFPVCSTSSSPNQLLISKATLSRFSKSQLPPNPLFPNLYLYQHN